MEADILGFLENLMDYHGQEEFKKQTRPMRMKLHPSTIGMCQRKIVFDMLMVPKEQPGNRLMRIFDNGHSLHHRYEKLFKEMGILVKDEMKLEADNISGHTDAWIRVFSMEWPDGQDYLVELKSAFSKSFEWMQKNNKPKNEHRDQLTFYLHLVRKQGIPIDKGIILVENKDTQEIWEFELDYDPVLGQRLEEKANWCISLAQKRTLPPIPPKHTPSYYKCGMCDYNFYCHSGSYKQNKEERYPIPFRFGSKAYAKSVQVIAAIQNNQPLPDVIVGDTNGELAVEVEEDNQLSSHGQPEELVTRYIETYKP